MKKPKTISKYGKSDKKQYPNIEIQKLALFYKENRIFVALIWGTNEKKRGHKTIITIFATKFNDL